MSAGFSLGCTAYTSTRTISSKGTVKQAEQLFVALKFLGREVEYVAFEGESHGLSRGGRPQNRGERLRRIVGWFDKHMK